MWYLSATQSILCSIFQTQKAQRPIGDLHFSRLGVEFKKGGSDSLPDSGGSSLYFWLVFVQDFGSMSTPMTGSAAVNSVGSKKF